MPALQSKTNAPQGLFRADGDKGQGDKEQNKGDFLSGFDRVK